MKKFILIGLALAVTLIAGGAGYAKHSADVKHDRQVAAHKAKVEKIQAAYRQNLAQYQTDHEHWVSDTGKYETCKSYTAEAFAAIDKLDGVITAGASYDGYSDAVAKVAAATSTLARDFNVDCMTIALSLDTANTQFAKAGSTWRTWYNNTLNGTESRDLEDLPLQKHWDKADSAVEDATTALNDMKPNGTEPVKPPRPNLSNV
jgi:hypothetical protein